MNDGDAKQLQIVHRSGRDSDTFAFWWFSVHKLFYAQSYFKYYIKLPLGSVYVEYMKHEMNFVFNLDLIRNISHYICADILKSLESEFQNTSHPMHFR